MANDDNVSRTVPLLIVSDIGASLRFYVDGLGFTMSDEWVVNGHRRWCRLEHGGAAVMLEEFRANQRETRFPDGVGKGIDLYFMCRDALAIYHEVTARGIEAATPFVGNSMWVMNVVDPDGYQLAFESPTNTPEDTVYG